jgi:hypothetical protein
MNRLSSLRFLGIGGSAVLGGLIIALALDVLIIDGKSLGDLVTKRSLVIDTTNVLES